MSDEPGYSGLAGAEVDVIYGLMSKRADSLAATNFEFAWQRDQALIEAIDGALRDAASARPGIEARKPRWLEGLVQRELRAASQAFWSRERFVRFVSACKVPLRCWHRTRAPGCARSARSPGPSSSGR